MPESPLAHTEHAKSDAPLPRPAVEHASYPRNHILFGDAGLRAGWGIALFFILLLLARVFVYHALATLRVLLPASPPGSDPHAITPDVTVLNDALPFACVVLITWLLAKIEHRPATSYGLGGTRKLLDFAAGLLWGVAFLSLLVLLLCVAGLLRFDARLLSGAPAFAYAAAWSVAFLLVALFEETFMRGYLQFTLARGFSAIFAHLFESPHSDLLGFWVAALLLSLLFGAGHSGNPGESPLGLLSATLAGLVFCLSLWRTGSLWWAIGFHAAWDWAQSFLYGVSDSGTLSAGRLFATHPVGRPIVSGGLTGPEGSLFVIPVLALAAVVIVLTLRPSARPPAKAT